LLFLYIIPPLYKNINMLKIGVLGVGHLGKIHLKCIKLVDQYELVGFYDPSDENAQKAIETYNIKRFEDIDDLLDAVDVVDIVTPTTTHFQLAKKALQKGKHIFIEKPLTQTVEEGEQLVRLQKETGLKVQVGHVERFNPAFLALSDFSLEPMFVEAHRLANFNPRGTDVSVVLDLMIHDLDIILSLIKSPITQISASGVAVVSPSPDISNARLEFENGAVANITASRLSLKQMRKIRFFQHDAYISLDFLEKNAQVVRLFESNDPLVAQLDNLMPLDTPTGQKMIHIDMPEIEPTNAIKLELETLAHCILEDTSPKVTIEEGYRALRVAHQIIQRIEERGYSSIV